MDIEMSSVIKPGKLACYDSMSGLVKVRLTGNSRPNEANIIELECEVTADCGPWKRGAKQWWHAHRVVPRGNVMRHKYSTRIVATSWTR